MSKRVATSIISSRDSECTKAPCNVSTFASGLKWPLGISIVGGNILVTLDAEIVSISQNGTVKPFSVRRDCGYLFAAKDKVFVTNGSIISYNSRCNGPGCEPVMVWNASGIAKVFGAVAYVAPAQA